jgi:hypothetical protein
MKLGKLNTKHTESSLTKRNTQEDQNKKVKTCYTAIFGPYDDLKQPINPSMVKGWKMICFTDQELFPPVDNVWEIRRLKLKDDPIKTARWFKINFYNFLLCKYSLWIDGTFIINVNLDEWWERFQAPFTTIKHPFKSCIYDEIRACLEAEKGCPKELQSQFARYRAEKVPENNGLIASGILMRENRKEVVDFCKTWWEEVENYSTRDQVAFGYAQFKHPGVHHSINWDYTTQTEFCHIPHLHKPWRVKRLKEVYALNSK